MSLFKAREWWSCQVGNGEQFDYGCLKVGSFNDDTNHKVVVGSHSGVLRIYNPTGSESDAVNQSHATDLLLERNLGMPIIQVEIGHFAGTSDSKQIAVLFSQKLSVFDYNEQSGMTEHGRQVGLELNYEHNFNRPTFNMCKGQFGGGRGSKDSTNHEYICVQTLDGVLYVFENERQSMAKSLPNTYLPGPIAYLSRPDAFLTVSSNYHLECYKYQTLAISSGLDSSSTNANDARRKGMDDDPSVALSQSASKRIQPEWTFNLGEAALGIQVSQRVRQSQQTILVLGERNLFCLNENGQMIFMKKFEYNPSSFVVYHHEASLSSSQSEGAGAVGVRYIIGTHSHTLFICQDAQIRWAAHVESVPVHIDVCTLQGVRGMICTLSETGQLQCCYLGTDPVSTTISTVTPGSLINSQEAKEQLDKLDKKIKEAMNDPSLIVRRKSNAQVSLKIDASEQFSMTDETRFLRSDVESSVPSTALRISVKSTEAIQNALLTVHVHSPLCAQPNEIRLGHIGGTAAIGTGTITFWMRDDLTPWNLEATFTVSYNTMSDNASHTVQKVHKLPLKLVAHAVQQAPSAANAGSCKITIGANKPVVDPGTIFPELANGDSSQQGVNARFYGSNQNVCVLASSKSQKYRIQSDSIANTWLFCQMLIERLSASSPIEFEYGDALPYQDYFALIDRHFEYRVECEQLNATLDICSKQFRAIQKRLLNKFKDKTPTLLDNLDVLSESTSQQILALADRYEQSRYELDRCSHDLSCTTKLICLLLKISVNLSSENTRLLNAILSPVISDDNEQGWEETVESAVCYALRTSLARSKSSDLGTSSNTIGNSTVNMDISRLKKRIQTLCERMEKGGSLVSSDSYGDRGNSTESSYSASSTSNPKGRSSSSSAGYSSHREMNNGEDEENGLPTDDHGSTFLLLPSTNSRRTIREEDEDD